MYLVHVTCALGFEKALGNELRNLAFDLKKSGPGFHEVEGGVRECLFLLRSLHCAERIFLVLVEAEVQDFDQLFTAIQGLPWTQFLKNGQGLVIDKVRLQDSSLRSVSDTQAVAHKAACDALCRAQGIAILPMDGVVHRIRLLAQGSVLKVLLDLSGEALHRRGWRLEQGVAPLKETIAAAMILLSGWRRKYRFWDPCCGSGTLGLEALAFAYCLPAHPHRRFALHDLAIMDESLEQRVKEELEDEIARDAQVSVVMGDIDPAMVALARKNLDRFARLYGQDPDLERRLRNSVLWYEGDVGSPALASWLPWRLDAKSEGFLLANPPYGERMGQKAEVEELYRQLGLLKRKLPGWTMELIVEDPDLDKLVGFYPLWHREVRNGSSQAQVFCFGPAPRPPSQAPARGRGGGRTGPGKAGRPGQGGKGPPGHQSHRK